MIGLRDAEAFRLKSIELQGTILSALGSAIAAREAQSEQFDRIRALEAEVTQLKNWDAEKQRYELKSHQLGGTFYMLKMEARDSQPPHWLCPNCFNSGKKSFFQPATNKEGGGYKCSSCHSVIQTYMVESPQWID